MAAPSGLTRFRATLRVGPLPAPRRGNHRGSTEKDPAILKK